MSLKHYSDLGGMSLQHPGFTLKWEHQLLSAEKSCPGFSWTEGFALDQNLSQVDAPVLGSWVGSDRRNGPAKDSIILDLLHRNH